MAKIIRNTGFFIFIAVFFWAIDHGSADAAVLEHPHFKVGGLVIVWGASGTDEPQISREIKIKPTSTAPPLDLPTTLTGHLVPTSALNLVALKDTQMHFYVASNTAFSIDAEVNHTANLSKEALRATAFHLRPSLGNGERFGQRAQYPHNAGAYGGINAAVRTLADLTSRTRVFTGNQRTAANPGSIIEQSVRFDITLTIDSTSGQVLGAAPEIVFTVFAP